MDKQYKKHLLSLGKKMVGQIFPQFEQIRLSGADADYDRYVGSLLFRRDLERSRSVWLLVEPEVGASRRFFVSLGWVVKEGMTPLGIVGNEALLDAEGPIPGIDGGWIPLEQVEGRNAVSGILVPSPWDRLGVLDLRATNAEERAVMRACDEAAQALSDADRQEAVRKALEEVCTRIQALLPSFTRRVLDLP
jgi:hypothetical protein